MGESLSLASSIVKYPNDIAITIKEYQKEMYERVEPVAAITPENLVFSNDAPSIFVTRMSELMQPH